MKLAARLVVPAVASLALIGLGSFAIAKAAPAVVQQVQTLFTDVTVSPSPIPSPTDVPSPVVQVILPSPVPTTIPTPPPVPIAFPHVQGPTGTVNSTPVEVPVPQTAVFIGIALINGGAPAQYSDSNTGGVICNSPCTIVFTADWQGGFAGVTPTFKWSDGATGAQDSHTYSAAGVYHISVIADEVYQGVTYEVGSNSGPVITTR